MQFYYFVDGERKGPIDAPRLKTLAALGKIVKETEIELEDGRRIQARKVKGLTFSGETPEEKVEAGEIYGVVAPPPIAESTVSESETDSTGPTEDGATVPPPVAVPGAAPSVPQAVSRPAATAKKGNFGASVVLFVLSAVFLTAALGSACVGFAQLKKAKPGSNDAEYAPAPTASAEESATNRSDDAEDEPTTPFVLAPDTERLDELDAERERRFKLLNEFPTTSEAEFLALNSLGIWQMKALTDARMRPSASAEAYMAALNRLDFDKHEFVGGDAYNYEVNASLFTGFATLGVGTDVRDVGDKVQTLGKNVRGVGDKVQTLGADVRALGTDVRNVGENVKTIGKNVRAVGADVRDVGTNVVSAAAVVAAGAGFVCAALFASTAALLFGLGILARRNDGASNA